MEARANLARIVLFWFEKGLYQGYFSDFERWGSKGHMVTGNKGGMCFGTLIFVRNEEK
jgi:hypothetical protein